MNLGIRSVTLLKYHGLGLKEGDVVEAHVWLNLDSYEPCAEVHTDGMVVGLGRISAGGWEPVEPLGELLVHFA